MRSCQMRFMDNNYNSTEDVNVIVSASSELAAFPASNASTPQRSTVWQPSGNFTVTATNNLVYLNDGADKTATVPVGAYTGATLASAIRTAILAVSSDWNVTYSSTTSKFTVTKTSGSAILRFQVTTNAIWDVIGFTQNVENGTSPWVSDEPRNHTEEWYKLDCVMPMEALFVAVIGPIDEPLSFSARSTIKIQGNNVDQWTSPPLDLTLTRSDRGAFRFLDDLDEYDRIYRYWRLYLEDRTNPITGTGFEIGHIYIGDYRTFTSTNVSRGFRKTRVDPSSKSFSESGAYYSRSQTKYRTISSLEVQNVPGAEHRAIEQLFQDLGTSNSFYVSLDPTLAVTEAIDELTFYGSFDGEPTFQHLFKDYYQIGFELRESV